MSNIPEEVHIVREAGYTSKPHRSLSQGRQLNRSTVRFASAPEFVSPQRMQIRRLALLATGVFLGLLCAAAIIVFYQDLGVTYVTSTRLAASIIVVSLVTLLTGLYRLLLGKGSPKSRQRNFANLSELHSYEYQATDGHRHRVEGLLVISLTVALLTTLIGVIVTIFEVWGASRAGGLATAGIGGAVALFVKSIMIPAHRQAHANSRQAQKDLARLLPRNTNSKLQIQSGNETDAASE